MIPPFPEPFLAYSNVPRTGADFQGKVRQIFIAPATKAHEKKLDRLEQVEKAEESLRQLGFRELRVRHHGEVARVEIARAELPRALSMEMMDSISAALRQAGFTYVTLDCEGFRSGAMNVVLSADVLAKRGA